LGLTKKEISPGHAFSSVLTPVISISLPVYSRPNCCAIELNINGIIYFLFFQALLSSLMMLGVTSADLETNGIWVLLKMAV